MRPIGIEKDKKIAYTYAAVLFALLLATLFIPGEYVRYSAAALLAAAALLGAYLLKKRRAPSMNKNQVLILVLASALVFIMAFYISGLYFGFWKSAVPIAFVNLLKYVIPIGLIIVGSETVRRLLLSHELAGAGVIAYFIGVLSELAITTGLSNVITFNRFMDVVGMALFPALSANLMLNYLSSRYGAYPGALYRLCITLYPYLIPYEPAAPDALMAFASFLLPLAVWQFIDLLFEKKRRYALAKKVGKLSYAVFGVVIIAAALVIMLISCRFKYGLLVIATDSMTGEINKGDAVIYVAYDGQQIEEGQVIVFEKDDVKVVHRVVEIEQINGQRRYYTKGDANQDRDVGYVTDSQLIGLTDFKISYIGYPTIWIRDLFG